MFGKKETKELKEIDNKKSNELKDQIKTFIQEGKENKTGNEEEISKDELEKIKKIANEGGQHGLYGCTIC